MNINLKLSALTLTCHYILIALLVNVWFLFSGVLSAQGGKIKIVQVGYLDLQVVFEQVREDSLLKYILEQGASKDLLEARTLDKKLSELKILLEKAQNGGNTLKTETLQNEIAYLQSQLRFLLADAASVSIEENDTDATLPSTILKEIYRIVRQVAQREGYSLILEAGVAVIYAEVALDITPLVLEELTKIKVASDF